MHGSTDVAGTAGIEVRTVSARALPSAVDDPTRRLPPDVVASLREAFAEELAERLPRLRQMAREASESSERDPELRTLAIRDAHTLGSSAYVVGEPEAAGLARRTEALLLDDHRDPRALVAALGALDAALRCWQP